MSEIATAAPAADSAPTSADLATSVVQDAEQAETPASANASTESVVEEPRAQVTKPVAPVTLTDDEQVVEALLKEFGFHEMKKPDGREYYIPRSKVQKMIGSGLKRGQEKWTTERGVFDGQLKELTGHLEQLRNGVAGDPKAFLAELAGIDARYKAFLEPQAVAREQVIPADDPMPAPDYDLGNGQKTYSLEGLQKRDAWLERQMLRKLDAKVDERFKPVAEREKAEQARAERQRVHDAAMGRAHDQMTEAQTWPLFGKLSADGSLTEFQQAVLDELKKDTDTATAAGKRPTLSFEGAYIKVASKHMTEDDTTRRARLLKEIDGAPKAPALARQPADGKAKPRTTAEITRAVVAAAENA